jgi:NAD(P)H-dependent FMN reductase
MRLLVVNGSPRGLKSNTRLLLDRLVEGFEGEGGEALEVLYLLRQREPALWLERVRSAEAVLLAFPLYADAMPAVVKELIEALGELRKTEGGPPFYYLVQSGFPEAHHSRFVARYLEKLCRRLGVRHGGTLVRGGVEGIQVMPPSMTKKLYALCTEAGRELARSGAWSEDLRRRFAGREKFGAWGRLVVRTLRATGIINMYWKGQLKQHGAWDRRDARPYAPAKKVDTLPSAE